MKDRDILKNIRFFNNLKNTIIRYNHKKESVIFYIFVIDPIKRCL